MPALYRHWQQAALNSGKRPDAQPTPAPVGIANSADAFIQRPYGRACMSEQRQPRLGKRHALRRAFEKRRFKNLLKLAYCLGNARLSNRQRLGSTRKAAPLGHFEKRHQVT